MAGVSESSRSRGRRGWRGAISSFVSCGFIVSVAGFNGSYETLTLFGHFVGRAAPIVRCCPVSGPRGCVSSDRCLLVSRWSDRSGCAGGPPLWRSSPLEGVDSTGVQRNWVCLVVCGWNAPRRREESRRGTMSARATRGIDVATNGDTAGRGAWRVDRGRGLGWNV